MDYSAYSPDRINKLSNWSRNRNFCAGADAVRAAQSVYLPKPAGMPLPLYNEYANTVVMLPAAARTLQGHTGLVFRRSPTLIAPETFLLSCQTLTADAHDHTHVTKWAFREFATTNDGGLLVTYPAEGGEQAFLAPYSAENIRHVEYNGFNGRRSLSRVVLSDDVETARELVIEDGRYTVNIYKKTLDGWSLASTYVPLVRGQALGIIPFITLNDGEDGAAMDDICDLNRTHFVQSGKLELSLLWVAHPVPVMSGVEKDKASEFNVYPGAMWCFESPDATAIILEPKGDGIPALERHITSIEKHMEALGSRMLATEKSAAEAAETLSRRQAGENSLLASMANHVSAKMTEALRLKAVWDGIDPTTVNYALNTDFVPATMDAGVLRELREHTQAGLMPRSVYFDNLKRGELVSDAVTFEEFEAELDAAANALPEVGTDGFV